MNKNLKGNGQKKAIGDVQPSLQLLPLIMHNIPQAVFWKDRDLVYLGCNRAFAEDAGLASPEEVVGKTDFEMPWKEQAELYRADDCLVMEKGQPKLNYEEPQTTPDGSTIWLRTSKIPVQEGGKIIAVLGMYEDITEYKKAQQANQDERLRFQTILETIRVPTIISRLSDGQVLYANQAIAQISQVDLKKLIGFKTGSFYVNPDDQKKVRDALRASGHIEDFEVQFRRTDGSTYWALLSSRIINYEGETCVLSSYVDITARKQAEQALRESQQFLQIVMDNIPQSIFWKDSNLTYLGCNSAFADDAGLASPSEALGKTDWDMPWKEQAELYRADDSLVMKNGTSKLNYEEPQTTPDGSTIWLRTSKVPLHDSEGTIFAVLGMYEDITARKQVEAALKAHDEFSQKQASAFAELARSEKLYGGEIQAAFAEVTEAAAQTLGVQRASIWYYNEDRTEIRCMDLFEQGKGHFEGIVLSKNDFPSYFKALEEERVIAADNAHTDPATREFSASYLTPLGINSMLDAPIRLRGHVIGVICNEHVGPLRPWTMEEQNFARTIVDFVTVAVETQERKQAEAAVYESEERFRRFTEATNEGLVFHEQGRITDANPAGLAMFGLTESSNFIGRNLLEFVLPEFHRLILEKMQLEDVPPYEVQCIRADNSIFPVETTTRTYQRGDRTIRATSIRDITARKQAEEALREANARMQAVLDAATQEAIIATDPTGLLTIFNTGAEQILGYSAEELVGKQTPAVIHLESEVVARGKELTEEFGRPIQGFDVFVEYARQGRVEEREWTYVRKDGGHLTVNLVVTALRDAEGNITGFLGIARDITARKQAEQELLLRERALASSLNAVFISSLDSKTLYVNDAFLKLFGYTREEAMQLTPLDVAADPEDLQKSMSALQSQGFYTSESFTKRKDGSLIPVVLTSSLIRNAEGQPIATQAAFMDITDRNELERQIQTALERRGLQVQLSTKVSQSIAAAASLEELYPRVVTQVKEQFDYYHTQILRYDAAQEAVVLVSGYGEVGAKMLAAGHRLPLGEGLIGAAAATGEAVLRPVLENDPDWHPNPLLPETKGEIAVPIKLGDTILGVLDVQSNLAGALDADDQLLLEGLCGQIAVAIESTRLRQEMTERLEEINRLYRAMSHEGWQTYRATTDLPSGLMYDQGGLRPVQDTGLAEELFASVPLTVPGGEVIGTLAIQDDPLRPISPEDEAFLQQVSEQVALALESARLFEQTQSALTEVERRASELETVATVSTTASTVLDPDQLLQSVVNLTKERFNLYHAHVYLVTPENDALVLAAGAGEVGKQMLAEGWSIPISHELSIVANSYRSQHSVVANDLRHDKKSAFLSNRLLPNTRSEMALPLIVGDRVLGVFDVQSDQPNFFTAEDVNIYTTLASQVAVALQNARLYVEQAALVTQLRELDKLKSSFLANMSHELRTPLNSILGFADVIIEELDGPLTENMNNDLRLIQKNGQHLLHLINDVLDMAKIEAGRMNLNPESFTAFEVLEEVTSITSTLASEKNLSLFIDESSDQDVKIYADRTRLRQVMINLVNNAIKFTETGNISLKLASIAGARILITVKDTGIGIATDKLEPIFQEFTQVDASSTRKAGGTGLGLPISRRLVEMHGGRLWAESTGIPGEGSTFFVELPVEARITETVEKQVK